MTIKIKKANRFSVLLLGFIMLAAIPAWAQSMDHSTMGAHGMDAQSYSDQAFLSAMIVHHQAAVEMSQAVIRDGRDSQVKKWAEDIIKAQNEEIEKMKQWLTDLGGENVQAASAMSRSMREMMAGGQMNDADRDFITMMIVHHAGAVQMATEAIVKSDDQRIIDLSRDIINTQVEEIIEYKSWLKQNQIGA